MTGQVQCHHPDEVHRADARPDYGAAGQARKAKAVADGNLYAAGGYRHGAEQRQQGKPQVVGCGMAGIEGQHGDEVGRPDTEAGGCTRRQRPPQAGGARRRLGTTDKQDGDGAGYDTDQRGQGNEPPVVLSLQAVENSVHVTDLRRVGLPNVTGRAFFDVKRVG